MFTAIYYLNYVIVYNSDCRFGSDTFHMSTWMVIIKRAFRAHEWQSLFSSLETKGMID